MSSRAINPTNTASPPSNPLNQNVSTGEINPKLMAQQCYNTCYNTYNKLAPRVTKAVTKALDDNKLAIIGTVTSAALVYTFPLLSLISGTIGFITNKNSNQEIFTKKDITLTAVGVLGVVMGSGSLAALAIIVGGIGLGRLANNFYRKTPPLLQNIPNKLFLNNKYTAKYTASAKTFLDKNKLAIIGMVASLALAYSFPISSLLIGAIGFATNKCSPRNNIFTKSNATLAMVGVLGIAMPTSLLATTALIVGEVSLGKIANNVYNKHLLTYYTDFRRVTNNVYRKVTGKV